MSAIDTDPAVLNKLQPTEALNRVLQKAQADHRDCVKAALANGEDVVEKCNLTWGEVYHRYRQWSSYRAPFEDGEAKSAFDRVWTAKRIDWYEKQPKF